jgi:hypothetical protein
VAQTSDHSKTAEHTMAGRCSAVLPPISPILIHNHNHRTQPSSVARTPLVGRTKTLHADLAQIHILDPWILHTPAPRCTRVSRLRHPFYRCRSCPTIYMLYMNSRTTSIRAQLVHRTTYIESLVGTLTRHIDKQYRLSPERIFT